MLKPYGARGNLICTVSASFCRCLLQNGLPTPIDPYEAADVLLKYMYSGVLGSTKDMGVGYALMHTTDSAFTYSAALEPINGSRCPLDRYQIEINRRTKELSAPRKIEITDQDMQEAILNATGETVASSCRFTDGGLSISYKVTTTQKPDAGYVVQLRHHGNVASMDTLMNFVRANNQPGVIPIPTVYLIPGEAEYQQVTGFGRQIAQFVPGVIAEEVSSQLSHASRLELVRKMALAWQALWDLPLPIPRKIGELVAVEDSGEIKLSVGPDRHFSLGGPFTSVGEWLRARIQHAVTSLERATAVDDFKDKYLAPIKAFADTCLHQIPEVVDECPVVAIHVDMGLHNVLVSTSDHTVITGIIDWEFCASAPFLAAYECIDMLFREGAPNGFGPEYPQAEELRRTF